jgi:hypothetical protein
MRRSWRIALIVGAILAVLAATSAGASKFITGGDIKNGSIGIRDLSGSAKRALRGQRGLAGPSGPTGPQGPAGAAGPASLSTTVASQLFTADGSGEARGEVRCPSGMVAVGGSVSPGATFVTTDLPSGDGRGWIGDAFGDPGDPIKIAVICTPGSATVLPTGI